ncbi:hypothetical protein LOZ58_006460 [Ophidiomyces ophidiicola]|nr:hypothetical protein LOZ65_002277 [Ophidiomyces ophidiicola]KAI1956198.1 hypothetical protein LOZ58_006460 [Ophidiomyces ophidiicola]
MSAKNIAGEKSGDKAAENTIPATVSTSGVQTLAGYGDIPGNSTHESRPVGLRAVVGGKKVIARKLTHTSSSSLNSLSSQMASLKLDPVSSSLEDADPSTRVNDDSRQAQHSLFLHVLGWLRNEKLKLAERKGTIGTERSVSQVPNLASSQSCADESELALDQLERILAQYSSSREINRPKGAQTPKQRPTLAKGLRRGSLSDSDYTDTDQAAPSADVTLDNSKTLLYSGGEADGDIDALRTGKPSTKDRESWLKFKSEIVRLSHTLGIKGWRRVPLEAGGEVEVIRLSGALTNAVYVVSPPKNLPVSQASDTSLVSMRRKPPPKLLLRIYGPQVEHLIDREHELQILRRLGKKNIGPRVLGTFNNGRFEQYFNAKPLTTSELRIPETSKQIAKRMKELHYGIELLPEEREDGPKLWRNWDKWEDRCEKVATWLDQQILSQQDDVNRPAEYWRSRGFVCCVPWPTFRAAVEKYRQWLNDQFGGEKEIAKLLVFAHNDTQYGNLLRLQPSEESPLLLPANEHKQLIVIDFEYASANMRGVEFANHFTEWCYNYHDSERPWGCHTSWYPSPEEQERFIRAYLKHRPQVITLQGADGSMPPSQSTTPVPTPIGRATYINSPRVPPFALDTYVPGLNPPLADLENQNPAVEAEVKKLVHETRLWRVANSAQWVAWGIVQATVPGLNKALEGPDKSPSGPPESKDLASTIEPVKANSEHDDEQSRKEAEAEELADDFDYLGYAQDRALFFWSDLLALGFIKEEELPTEMIKHIKKRVIKY